MQTDTLDRNQVRDLFLKTLREFLGEKAPTNITETTDPITELGLDSPDGVDFACVLTEKFGYKVPDNINPFVDDARHCPRLLGDAIDLMCDLIKKGNS